MSQSYRSDLTDEQWEVIQTLIPPANTKSDYQHGSGICFLTITHFLPSKYTFGLDFKLDLIPICYLPACGHMRSGILVSWQASSHIGIGYQLLKSK